MKLPVKVDLPYNAPDGWGKNLSKALTTLLGSITKQVNGLTEGAGNTEILHSALLTAPVSGTHAQNDFVPNANIVELGAPGSKYILKGWRCIAGGEPGIFVEERCLTGN